MGVYDIDPIHLIQMVKGLRDDHRLMNGLAITGEVPMFIARSPTPPSIRRASDFGAAQEGCRRR